MLVGVMRAEGKGREFGRRAFSQTGIMLGVGVGLTERNSYDRGRNLIPIFGEKVDPLFR